MAADDAFGVLEALERAEQEHQASLPADPGAEHEDDGADDQVDSMRTAGRGTETAARLWPTSRCPSVRMRGRTGDGRGHEETQDA
jgi:hypothetical protein